MIPQDAAFKQIFWIWGAGGQVWLLRSGSKMKGLADPERPLERGCEGVPAPCSFPKH